MRSSLLAAALLWSAACANGTVADDPACGTIGVQEQRLISTLTDCQTDADCVIVELTACGLNGVCAAAISADAQPQFDVVRAAWSHDCEASQQQCGACAHAAVSARCVRSVCQCEGSGC